MDKTIVIILPRLFSSLLLLRAGPSGEGMPVYRFFHWKEGPIITHKNIHVVSAGVCAGLKHNQA